MISDTPQERSDRERRERELEDRDQYLVDCEKASIVPHLPADPALDAWLAARRETRAQVRGACLAARLHLRAAVQELADVGVTGDAADDLLRRLRALVEAAAIACVQEEQP